LALWLHAFRQDEHSFLEFIIPIFDRAIACGQLPPFIIAAPDGSIKGRSTYCGGASFFLNSLAGNFEDFVIQDVWPFLIESFPVRPEREAHVLMGASMGGGAAFTLAFKHRETFKVAVGLFPPLNLRWEDCHGRYRSHFDPCCWGWRDELRPCEVVARLYGIPIRQWQLTRPLYDHLPDAIDRISQDNPIELLDSLEIKPGEFDLYAAYGGKDEFYTDAQVESFLYVARERGIEVGVGYEPNGRHNMRTGLKLFPGIAEWLHEHLAPYSLGIP
jgi:hypothetical protein